MNLSELKANPRNPRLIKDERFKKLVQSIKEFPKMLELRPIIIDKDDMILAGNMRFKALKELGYKDIEDAWVKRADELTEDEIKRFIIVDNVGFGEDDYDILAADYETDDLLDWGVELPNPEDSDNDISYVDDFSNNVNFIVKCENLSEMEFLQKKLHVEKTSIECKQLITLIR